MSWYYRRWLCAWKEGGFDGGVVLSGAAVMRVKLESHILRHVLRLRREGRTWLV